MWQNPEDPFEVFSGGLDGELRGWEGSYGCCSMLLGSGVDCMGEWCARVFVSQSALLCYSAPISPSVDYRRQNGRS